MIMILLFLADIDECSIGNSCDSLTTDGCVNTVGDYQCICKPGYKYNTKSNKKCFGEFTCIPFCKKLN